MVVPGSTPDTWPESEVTVAIEKLVVAQSPPPTIFVRYVVAPWHTESRPTIGARGFTVISSVALQPTPFVYVITVVPIDTPVTTPLVSPMVAFAVLPLTQVPPVGMPNRLIVSPWHTT